MGVQAIDVTGRVLGILDEVDSLVEELRDVMGLGDAECCAEEDPDVCGCCGDVYNDYSLTLNFFGDEKPVDGPSDEVVERIRQYAMRDENAKKRFLDVISRIPKPTFKVGEKVWAVVYGRVVCAEVEDTVIGYYKTTKGMVSFTRAFASKQELMKDLADNADE